MKPEQTTLPDLGHDPLAPTARWSPCGLYRYELTRTWDAAREPLVVIGLNPSTATEHLDDPTIRRCMGFARREGAGGLIMLNLYALRSTDRRALRTHADPVGPDNDRWLHWWLGTEPELRAVAAWGTWGGLHGRDRVLAERYPCRLLCWRVTRDGHPQHPLYLPNDAPLQPWPGRR